MRISLKKLPAICGFSLLLGVALFSCSKDDNKILDPGQKVFFTPAQSTANYAIVNANTVYKIPVGLTSPVSSGKTKTVNVTATSSTGAVEGTQYTYTKTLTFTPDKITDTIVVTGVYNQYLAGRKDVLKFTFADAGDFSPSLNSSFTLNVSGPCYEGDIAFADLLGDYPETYENGSYGPYTSSISNLTPGSSPNTAKAIINNIYDNGISAQATFDYSTVGAFTLTVDPQATGLGVGGQPLFIRTTPGTTSTFSYCNKTFTIYLDLYTAGGLYDSWVMTMATE
ncbi:MAG: hypothetical protein ACTHMV_05310 [Chitinophagaceae bacterium]